MDGVQSQLRQVELPQTDQPKPQKSSIIEQAATEALLFGIQQLSKRFIVALGQLFTTFSTLSVFFLAYIVSPNPTVNQLVCLGLYGLFVLFLHVIIRRKD